jgi:putative toxin-antitoxin system antitoxin component (TIGR02293 family)
MTEPGSGLLAKDDLDCTNRQDALIILASCPVCAVQRYGPAKISCRAPGGEEVIGQGVHSELELAELVRIGFRPVVIDKPFHGGVFTKPHMERLVMPRRALNHRIQKGERSTREGSNRVTRVVPLVTMAEETFGNRNKASSWLHKHKRGFGGQTPIDLRDSEEGTRVVEDRLFRIAHGLRIPVSLGTLSVHLYWKRRGNY